MWKINFETTNNARSRKCIQGFYTGFVNVYIDMQCYVNIVSLCPIWT